MAMNGVTFGEKHSYRDFHLILSKKEITFPEAKVETVEIPGMDGALDLTEALTGETRYKNRSLTLTFTMQDAVANWGGVLSRFANYLHGRKMQITLDEDHTFSYNGRCSINQFATDRRTATLVVLCDVEPYKMEAHPTSEPWEWDGFSFLNGIIYTGRAVVNGAAVINLINRRKEVSPSFTCTAQMKATFEGAAYDLPKGTTKVYGIRLKEGDNLVTFTGVGVVTIDYRGGSL